MYEKQVSVPRLYTSMRDDPISSEEENSDSGNEYMSHKSLPWSEPIKKIKEVLEDLLHYRFNYVLINLYRDGNDHIR